MLYFDSKFIAGCPCIVCDEMQGHPLVKITQTSVEFISFSGHNVCVCLITKAIRSNLNTEKSAHLSSNIEVRQLET